MTSLLQRAKICFLQLLSISAAFARSHQSGNGVRSGANNLCLICTLCALKSRNLYSSLAPQFGKQFRMSCRNDCPPPASTIKRIQGSILVPIIRVICALSPRICALLFSQLFEKQFWGGCKNGTPSLKRIQGSILGLRICAVCALKCQNFCSLPFSAIRKTILGGGSILLCLDPFRRRRSFLEKKRKIEKGPEKLAYYDKLV